MLKVIEQRLQLNNTQTKKLEQWISIQNWVWNRGLALIEWREWYNKWENVTQSKICMEGVEPTDLRWHSYGKEWALSCPCVGWRKYNPQEDQHLLQGKGAEGDRVWAANGEWREKIEGGKWLVAFPQKQLVKDHWITEPLLDGLPKNPAFSLQKCFKFSKEYKSPAGIKKIKHSVGDCPYKFCQGTITELGKAWKSYRKGDRSRPRYKGKKNKMRSLLHYNGATDCRMVGNRIRIPNLGWVRCKGLEKRTEDAIEIVNPVKIVKDASGFYLQVTIEVEDKIEKQRLRAIGINAGLKRLYTDDHEHFALPADIERMKKRRDELQKKASWKWHQNTEKNGRAIAQKDPNWQRKNLHKLYAQIKKLDERIRRKRAAHLHFHADKICSLGDIIIREDLNLPGMTKRSKPKVDVDTGQFERNNAAAKSRLNRSFADVAIGAFFGAIESKAKSRGRLVVAVDPAGTSGTCHQCGLNHIKAGIEKSLYRPTQEQFICQNDDCGWTGNADHNAAINIKNRGLEILRDPVVVAELLEADQPKRSTRKGAKLSKPQSTSAPYRARLLGDLEVAKAMLK